MASKICFNRVPMTMGQCVCVWETCRSGHSWVVIVKSSHTDPRFTLSFLNVSALRYKNKIHSHISTKHTYRYSQNIQIQINVLLRCHCHIINLCGPTHNGTLAQSLNQKVTKKLILMWSADSACVALIVCLVLYLLNKKQHRLVGWLSNLFTNRLQCLGQWFEYEIGNTIKTDVLAPKFDNKRAEEL